MRRGKTRWCFKDRLVEKPEEALGDALPFFSLPGDCIVALDWETGAPAVPLPAACELLPDTEGVLDVYSFLGHMVAPYSRTRPSKAAPVAGRLWSVSMAGGYEDEAGLVEWVTFGADGSRHPTMMALCLFWPVLVRGIGLARPIGDDAPCSVTARGGLIPRMSAFD